MVLTIRPAGSDSWNGPDDSGSAERLAVRRATMPLLAERGLAGVSVDDIISAARISRRKFFRLFDGKSQVLSCDHEVYHLEVHTYLLQHQGERTFHRASKGAALIVDALTVVPEEAVVRQKLLNGNPALLSEELLWYTRYQRTIADFLTGESAPFPPVDAEMTAGAIVAGVRAAINTFAIGATDSAERAYAEAIETYLRAKTSARQIALIETELTFEQLLSRLQNHTD